jgi:hypothetical protein
VRALVCVLISLNLRTAAQVETSEDCRPPDPKVVLEPYAPPPNPMADIIITVDTSGSMGNEAGHLMQNINAFGQHLEDSGIDYRLVLIGTHPSWLCVKPPLAYTDCAKEGPSFKQISITVYENCLKVLLQPATYNEYSKVLRPGASKTFVAITDDQTYINQIAAYSFIQGDCDVNTCAGIWQQMLQQLDTKKLFTPTKKLPLGFIFHGITGQNCNGEPGHQKSKGMQSLVTATTGTMFKICEKDWSPMFVQMAKTVEATTDASAACTQKVPLSETDPTLLIGDLEPDTAFDMKFTFVNATSNETQRITITRSKAGGGGLACPAVAAPPKMLYKLDSVDNPRVVTLCESACQIVKNSVSGSNRAQGNLSFTFKPVAKLKSLTFSGRGYQSQSIFGPPRQIRPAVTYPMNHPALSRGVGQCSNGATSKPVIPDTGEVLFVNKSGGCPEVPGEELFYAVDAQGRSQTFARGGLQLSGLVVYFFVNTKGETYFGLQLGHDNDNYTATYAVVDVVLSGNARSGSSVQQTSWRVKDGLSANSDGFPDPNAKNGRTRVRLTNAQGKSAGGILGPLPAIDFCVDVNIIERDQEIKQVVVVDFAPGKNITGANASTSLTKYPGFPHAAIVAEEVLENGGIRFCADTCNGNATKNMSNSVKCFTKNDGTLVCPGGTNFDRGNRSNDDYSDIDFSPKEPFDKKSESGSSDPAPQDRFQTNGSNVDIVAGVVPPGKKSWPEWWMWAAIGGGAFLLIIVVVLFVRRRSRRANGKGDGQLKNIELSQAGHRRLKTTHSTSSVFGSGQYWVPPPPDEDMKVERSVKRKNRSKQKKLDTKHKSKISVGFEEVRLKRVSTFDKFLAAKGLQPASRDYSGVTKKRGPSMRHIARSDWDVFMCNVHNTEYYHNRKTGETSWTCPPEVVASLGMPTEATGGGAEISIEVENPMTQSASGSQSHYMMCHGPSGHPYYANTVTGEVTWVLPEGATLVEKWHADA